MNLTPEQFVSSWRIKANPQGSLSTHPIRVFRYMNEEHIDEFLKTGRIKLSSYESNRKCEGDVRQDGEEGYYTYRILSRDRSNGYEFRVDDRDVHRILCCSNKFDKELLCPHFKVDGCMEISNAFAFGYEVARVLQEYSYGREGIVDYVDDQVSYLLLENHPHLPDLPKDAMIHQTFAYIDEISKLDLGPFYRKPKKHFVESEYRLTWKCQQHHDMFIECPGAVKYCKKI